MALLIKLFYVNLEVIEASQELIDDETRRIVERNQTIADSFENVKNADAIQKVVDAYHTDEVKKVIKESSEGLDEPVW